MSGERHLPAECARLAGELRELRGRTGLSLAALAERTPYSKSSWERYLNGKKLPPRQAVETLCRLADEPAGRLLALWELAEQTWSGRAGAAAPAGPVAEDAGESGGDPAGESAGDPANPAGEAAGDAAGGPQAGGPRRVFGRAGKTFVMSGAVAVAAAVAVPLFLMADGHASGGGTPGSAAATSPYPQSYAPGCTGEECEGADPAQMGCGAQGLVDTLLTHTAAGGRRLEIRYSARCGAVWVRAMRLRLGDRVRLSLPGADTKEIKAAGQRDTEVYLSTAMTATRDPGGARVCLLPAAGGGPDCATAPRSGPGGRSSTPVGGPAAAPGAQDQ